MTALKGFALVRAVDSEPYAHLASGEEGIAKYLTEPDGGRHASSDIPQEFLR